MLAALAISLVLGFSATPSLNPWESAIAQKPAQVFCWHTAITAQGQQDAAGYTDSVGGTQTYLAPWICNALLKMQNHRKVDTQTASVAFFVFTHEAFHLRGVADESVTDCDALHAMPGYLHSLLHYTHAQIHTAMGWAWNAHWDEPALYKKDC